MVKVLDVNESDAVAPPTKSHSYGGTSIFSRSEFPFQIFVVWYFTCLYDYPRIMLILSAILFVVYCVSYFLTWYSRFLIACPILRKLWSEGHCHQFLPVDITRVGSHYAASQNGRDGFYRMRGFGKVFSPVINVFSSLITVFSICGYNVSCDIRVVRTSRDYVSIYVVSWTYRTRYYDPYLSFVSGECAVLGYLSSETTSRVRLQASPYVGCDLTLAEFDALRFRTGSKPNMGYMEYVTKDMEVSKEAIPWIAQVLKEELRTLDFEPWVRPGVDSNVEVVVLDSTNDVDLDCVKPVGKLIPQPYTHESITFAVNRPAEALTFKERVEKFVSLQEFVPEPEYFSFRNEFVQLLIPESECFSLAPDDEEVVLSRQNRPSQVLGYLECKDIPNPLFAMPDKSFQKGEVYPSITAPRNIIDPPPPKRVRTAAFVRPLTDHLKATTMKGIYGFGTAEYNQDNFHRMESVSDSNGGMSVYETDGTKMDANVTSFFRDLENMVGKRGFAKDYHDEFDDMHKSQYSQKCPKSKKGNKVNLGFSRRSGEGGTSTWNTIAMCFVVYCWLRKLGFSPKDCWSKLGLYGGDDGLTLAWGPRDLLVAVGDALHIPLKVKEIDRDSPWSFLGITKMPRIPVYSPDVVRFCSKIAYSHVKGVPVDQLLYRKCEPYVRMYPNVPLVGNLCRAVVRILSKRGFKVEARYDELCRSGVGYIMTMLDGDQLPGPQSSEEYDVLECYACDALGISLGTLREVCFRYDSAESFEDFPSGYIEKQNIFLACGFEALIRDLYIPGPSVENLADTVPTETPTSAVQNLSNNVNQKKEKSSETSSCISSASTGDCSSSSKDSSKTKASRKKRTKANKAGHGLSQGSASRS